jgi:7-carboxy-7-deazaguanine synthase
MPKTYHVKECFLTLQGEGARAGRVAVFLRFAGCNLWSGREQDRARAVCDFCDTDFRGVDGSGGGRFPGADAVAARVASLWSDQAGAGGEPYVVCTGGEPLLQLDAILIDALHRAGFEIAVETNGTRPVPEGVDWVCVSPKADAPLVQLRGDELKLVYPQVKAPPERFEGLDFRHFFLQPMDSSRLEANTAAAVRYCRDHPRWRLGVQLHKVVGIP